MRAHDGSDVKRCPIVRRARAHQRITAAPTQSIIISAHQVQRVRARVRASHNQNVRSHCPRQLMHKKNRRILKPERFPAHDQACAHARDRGKTEEFLLNRCIAVFDASLSNYQTIKQSSANAQARGERKKHKRFCWIIRAAVAPCRLAHCTLDTPGFH